MTFVILSASMRSGISRNNWCSVAFTRLILCFLTLSAVKNNGFNDYTHAGIDSRYLYAYLGLTLSKAPLIKVECVERHWRRFGLITGMK